MAGYIGSKASVVSNGAERKKVFDITATTTSLTGCSYTPNQVHVFHNGVRLVDGTDYTATDGSTVTLTTAAQSGDEVVVISYATFQTSDTVSASAGGTFSNAVTIDANGATVLTVDRATSDGTIIDLQRNGTTVGSIGSVSGGADLMIGTDTTGLRFYDGSNADGGVGIIVPWNVTSNAARDAQMNLGSSTERYRNLYLSGGVYLGGTGAANYLDDYEEGTWTPTVTSGITSPTYTTQTGFYRKVGNLVMATTQLALSSGTGNSSRVAISGLPFTSSSSGQYAGGGSFMFVNSSFLGGSTSTNVPTIFIDPNVTKFDFYATSGTSFLGTDFSTPSSINFYAVVWYFT